MAKLKYGQDALTLNVNETIESQARSPRFINGLGLPEDYIIVNRESGEEVNGNAYPEEGATYVIEVREQKKNATKKKPGTKKKPTAQK